jgi:trimethylamine:corrinoid methyltransferase-like protein
MPAERPPIEPLRPAHRLPFLNQRDLDQLQGATIQVLEQVGVRFPSDVALTIFGDHGANVNLKTQIVLQSNPKRPSILSPRRA